MGEMFSGPRKKVTDPQPIHEIEAWSGREQEETPLCGMDRHNPHVWGYRTTYTSQVTCPACIAIRANWAEMHDE